MEYKVTTVQKITNKFKEPYVMSYRKVKNYCMQITNYLTFKKAVMSKRRKESVARYFGS